MATKRQALSHDGELRPALLVDYIKIARPDHWIKNLFILPGFLIAVLLIDQPPDASVYCRVVMAFLSTCLISSANYVINEWLDAQFDRFHPVKKNRPVVTANIRGKYVVIEYILLLSAGLLLGLFINRSFFLMSVFLLVMGIFYNVEPMRTKDIPYLDVLSESINNMIRLLMGWFIFAETTLPPCSIILGYWMSGAFLMATKRFAEYRMINNPEQAGMYRKSFKGYTEATLLASSFFYAIVSNFLIGIFLIKYKIELIVAFPFLVILFVKYILIAYKEDSAAQKPEKLYREKGLFLIIVLFSIAIVIGGTVKITFLDIFLGVKLISFE